MYTGKTRGGEGGEIERTPLNIVNKGSFRYTGFQYTSPFLRLVAPPFFVNFSAALYYLNAWNRLHGFLIPGTGFQSLSVGFGFQIPFVSGISDSLSCIPEFKARDDRSHREKFQGFQNPDSLIWGDSVLMAINKICMYVCMLDFQISLIIGIHNNYSTKWRWLVLIFTELRSSEVNIHD